VEEVEEGRPLSDEGVHLEGVPILVPAAAVAADPLYEVPSVPTLHLHEVLQRRGGLLLDLSAGAAAGAGHPVEVVQGRSPNKQRNLIN